MGLLEKLVISLSFGFCKICLKCWNLRLGNKKLSACLANVFWSNIWYWKCYHKHDMYNLIKCLVCRCISDSCFFLKYSLHSWHGMILRLISIWKSCRLGCTCHVCGNSFKTKCYIRKHLHKKHLIFFGSKFKISTFQTYFTKSKTSRNEKWKQ